MTEIYMPKLSGTMKDGILVSWEKELGDEVKSGEVLFEIETDKVTCQIEAAADGILDRKCFEEGERIPVGEVVAIIEGR